MQQWQNLIYCQDKHLELEEEVRQKEKGAGSTFNLELIWYICSKTKSPTIEAT